MRNSRTERRERSPSRRDSFLRTVAACVVAGAFTWSLPAASSAEDSTPHFIRGDVDGDGRVLTNDAVGILQFLFLGNPDDTHCLDAMDADDNGAVDVTDAVFLLDALFRGGEPPAEPFPFCGEDPTEDPIGCERSTSCSTHFVFYGQELSATGVFFVVDRSGSMRDAGELAVAKREIVKFLLEVPSIEQFGIVFLDANVTTYPSDRCPADGRDPAEREEAVSFVNSIPGGSGSCVQKGLLAALEFVECSTASRNIVIYIGDGGGTCGGVNEAAYLAATREAVAEVNGGRSEVHTFGVLMGGRTLQEEFLRQLAEENGGSYTRVGI